MTINSKKTETGHQWPGFLSVIAIIISLGSLIVSMKQCSLVENTMKLHLDPDLVCILDNHPEKEHFLLFTIKNEGMVAATNVSVDHVTARYIKKEKKIRLWSGGNGLVLDYNPPGKRWIYVQRLDPNIRAHKLTGESALRDSSAALDILIFDISYYRESDGKRYEKRRIFYVDGKDILTTAKFQTHSHYNDVESELSRIFEKGIYSEGWWPNKEKKQ